MVTEDTARTAAHRWVLKFGSALMTTSDHGLNHHDMHIWVEQIAQLRSQNHDVVVVSSGAVAEGMGRLGWQQRGRELDQLQAAAAIGQMGLVRAWETCFQAHAIRTAQILLTHDDLAHRQRYLNARACLRTLLGLGTIPVVNENDTVATDELRFGDNDTLAALVANLIEADTLLLLTDQEGLYERDPRQYPEAKLIRQAQAGDPTLEDCAGEGNGPGQGGMKTKLQAARVAARSGTRTLIASGRTPEVICRLAAGETLGTRLSPGQGPLAARMQWLAGQPHTGGELYLDAGALQAVLHNGKSLLPVGVKNVRGDFRRGEIVSCRDAAGREVARGLVNYSAAEVQRIMGRRSVDITAILGYTNAAELIHRDNLLVLQEPR